MNVKNPAIKRILADLRELEKNPSSRYYAVPLEENLFEWHFTIRGPNGSHFEGGIYHGRILLSPDYPFKPPNIVFLTKNGRFEVGTKICLSISAYHEETWQPAWGVRTMLEAIISFMPSEGAGAIGALDWTREERQKLALESYNYCCPICGVAARLLSEPKSDEDDVPGAEIAAQISQLKFQGTPPVDDTTKASASDEVPISPPAWSPQTPSLVLTKRDELSEQDKKPTATSSFAYNERIPTPRSDIFPRRPIRLSPTTGGEPVPHNDMKINETMEKNPSNNASSQLKPNASLNGDDTVEEVKTSDPPQVRKRELSERMPRGVGSLTVNSTSISTSNLTRNTINAQSVNSSRNITTEPVPRPPAIITGVRGRALGQEVRNQVPLPVSDAVDVALQSTLVGLGSLILFLTYRLFTLLYGSSDIR